MGIETNKPRYGALSSSQNSEELANRVKGIVLALSSVLIWLGTEVFGVSLTAQDITGLATSLGGMAGGIWAIYGTILWLVAKFAEVKNR